ncbi:MAG: LytTR family DNA-binding domain-containing protein [Synergistaceae bacterium]|nr:LytTR family DNA-binding domain-containing protein [Synergistaceae bacterium]
MKTFLRTAVCEDSPGDSARLRWIIECAEVSETAFFTSGEKFLASNPAGRYDVVFMDIYFSETSGAELTGLEAAQALRGADDRVEIVFTTTSEDYALEAYRMDAAQYLVKPLKSEDVEKTLRQAALKTEALQEVCSVTVNHRKVNIPLSKIIYAEVMGFRCLIHTTEGITETLCSLNKLEKLLPPPSFYRCHRSYIVNFRYVKEIDEDFTMKNGDVVYIGRRGAKEASDAYKMWLMDAVWRREI